MRHYHRLHPNAKFYRLPNHRAIRGRLLTEEEGRQHHKESAKKYRLRNLEKFNAYVKKWRKGHPEARKKWQRTYKQKHLDRVIASYERYRERHREEIIEYRKTYYAKTGT